MKNWLKVNDELGQLIMDKTFYKNSRIYGSREYLMLQKAKKDNPGYAVVQRKIKKNVSMEHYKGLTYTYMENYIEKYGGANVEALICEYKRLRDIVSAHSRGSRYPVVKSWFLEKFPEIDLLSPSMPDEEKCA